MAKVGFEKKIAFSKGIGAKSVIPAIKNNSMMMSSRAQRDIYSEKSDALNISRDSGGHNMTADLLNVSILSNKSILKGSKTGLFSIEEH